MHRVPGQRWITALCSALGHFNLFVGETLRELQEELLVVYYVLFTFSLFPDQRGKVSQKSYVHASLHLELFHYFSDYSAFSGKRKMPKRNRSDWWDADPARDPLHVFSGCVFLIIVIEPSVGACDDPVCCGCCSLLALVHMLVSLSVIILLCFVFLQFCFSSSLTYVLIRRYPVCT